MTLQIEQATRQGVIPLIGVYGKSGSGKTHSALALAMGIAGPDKEVGIIDTERKRSGALVGLLPRGFRRINLDAPFTPEIYSEALAMFEAEKLGCAVIDSLTHEWDGEGGVLEMQEDELQRMAGDDYKKREGCKMAAWIKPKMRHKSLIKHILRCNIPLICCLRADEKTHVEKNDGEKARVITDNFSTPVFDKRFIFEMLANLETVQYDGKPGCCYVTKWTHPDILALLPKTGEQIGLAHGEALARWCNTTVAAPKAAAADAEINAVKRELWDLTKKIHNGAAQTLLQWLWDEMCLDPNMSLGDLDAKELRSVLALARKKIK